MYVNLGVGIPTLLPRYLPSDMEIWIHTENGALGFFFNDIFIINLNFLKEWEITQNLVSMIQI